MTRLGHGGGTYLAECKISTKKICVFCKKNWKKIADRNQIIFFRCISVLLKHYQYDKFTSILWVILKNIPLDFMYSIEFY